MKLKQKRFKSERATHGRPLFKIYMKKRVKGKLQWVCVAIATGRFNNEELMRLLTR